jgi:hypothetical protein
MAPRRAHERPRPAMLVGEWEEDFVRESGEKILHVGRPIAIGALFLIWRHNGTQQPPPSHNSRLKSCLQIKSNPKSVVSRWSTSYLQRF